MKSLFANISIFLLVSAHIIFQTSTSAEAQQKPVSLLPETLNTTAPNTKSKAHEHTGPEEFFILEGDLTDSDGYIYKKGDFVQLSSGSSHYSTTKNGCISVVTHRGKYIYSED